MAAPAIVFDLDGTLVDSLRDIADAVDCVLAESGMPTHGLSAYRHMVGEGLGALVGRAMVEGADHAALLARVRARYVAHCLDTTRPYPGVRALVAALCVRAIPLAVLSNKPQDLTGRLVTTLFPGVNFAAVLGDAPGRPRKPDPAGALECAARLGRPAAACLLVGDTAIDLQTARAAGMVGVAVAWGFRPREELGALAPDHLIDTPAQLLGLLESAPKT